VLDIFASERDDLLRQADQLATVDGGEPAGEPR
jgi:hypothetical protein